MPDDTPLIRQWRLLRLLSSRRYGLTVQEMAEELGVREKTIRRTVEAFQLAGIPLEETVEDHGRKRWRLVSATMPELNFAFDEAVALYLGRHFLDPLAGTIFADAAQRAFAKIQAMLGPAAREYLQQFAAMFHPAGQGQHDYSQKSEILDELLQGIEEHRIVAITYQSLRATQPARYEVHPYGLAYHRSSLYLVGFAPQHGEIRHWKIDRMTAAELTDSHFDWPEGFDLQEHFRRSFGVFHGEEDVHVRVRFASAVARYVQEAIWHPSQRLSPEDDGSLLAEFQLSQTEELKHWVLGFGRHAVVLEPASLREEIAGELEGLLAAYS